MKKIFLLLFLFPLFATSQNENNWWFFGENAGLDFNSGVPVPVVGSLSVFEGCSSLSDELGNLMLYSDGSTVWDRNGNVMPGANGTLSGNSSSAQSALIHRDDRYPNIVHVFTVSGGSTGLRYTKVDMLLNNGLGDVVPGTLNTPVQSPTHEKITGYYDSTLGKTWVVTFNEPNFYAFEIINNVVSSNPVVSVLTSTAVLADIRGPMKISPDGTKVALVSVGDAAFIADFDTNSGTVSNPVQMTNSDPTHPRFYGVEFSPDSNFVYLDANSSGTGNGCGIQNTKQILQYDLSQSNFSNNPTQLNSMTLRGGRSGLQLGPDGKIYVARTCVDSLSVIEHPTIAGVGAGYIHNAIGLVPGTNSREGLPANFVTKIADAFNTITGTIKIDIDGNGCNANDPAYDNILISVVDNMNNTRLGFSNQGQYEVNVVDGDFTVTPILQNPNLWTVSPSSQMVNFPASNSPLTLDFCVTTVGSVVDDRIQMTPLGLARPGFNVSYRIDYSNEGNQTSSGIIDFNYDETVMTFVSATGGGQNLSGGIVRWNYSNFTPFSRENQTVTFNLNRPTDTPPLNGGDILNLTTRITPVATDADPSNNFSYFDQTVVNSFDPNDIVCHEGEVMPIGKVGERIDYTIRFENLGTAAARNVVIRMDVDDTMFDKSSLVVESTSHTQETNINREGQIEFIFRDINLDFNDATNDGFITYSIKTQPTLVAGDQIAQQAGIYFDYNFPIFTNTYVTTIDAVASSVTTDALEVSIYPVPATDFLNIKSVDSIDKIEVFTMTGQLIIEQSGSGNTSNVDVSNLDGGAYILRIESDGRTAHQRFVKQ